MKAWKTIVMAGATLALAAPVANATFDQTVTAKAPHAKLVHHKRVAPKVTTKTTPRMIIIIVPASPSAEAAPVDDCVVFGTNCTDQQLCDIWAVNCDLAAAEADDAAAQARTPNG